MIELDGTGNIHIVYYSKRWVSLSITSDYLGKSELKDLTLSTFNPRRNSFKFKLPEEIGIYSRLSHFSHRNTENKGIVIKIRICEGLNSFRCIIKLSLQFFWATWGLDKGGMAGFFRTVFKMTHSTATPHISCTFAWGALYKTIRNRGA